MTIPYKSFCWNFGTTSFRTKDFNKKIEEQLNLLNKFWLNNNNENWQGNKLLQEKFYDFMHSQGFLTGNAGKKDKDAREKTSGLVDIGLIYDDRKLSPVGKSLLELSQNSNFDKKDDFFNISKDSIIYLKQLLKTHSIVGNNTLRPFIIILYLISKLDYISFDEFEYLVPLCVNQQSTKKIIEDIIKLRNNQANINDIIYDNLISMDNYKQALDLFIKSEISENLICEIGLNRKSRNYDKAYYNLYCSLYEFYVNKNKKVSVLSKILADIDKIKLKKLWKSYIFASYSQKDILENQKRNETEFDKISDEKIFKKKFFKMMHIFKAKATLSDYFDLNVRYIKLADILLFSDSKISLDIIPKSFFKDIIDELYKLAYIKSDKLFDNCDFPEISNTLIFDEKKIISAVNQEFSVEITEPNQARELLEEQRYQNLLNLIETKFTNDNLIKLLNNFEQRKDEDIRNFITDNADIPTIFEYIVGIIWFKISEYKGKVLDYMKLSLDANLLPKSHAAGGIADIVYEYEESEDYPKHSLLIELTLSKEDTQRRMEMEPVSRHLGEHLLKTKNKNSYCVFATTYLDFNVISDFRNRKNYFYYNPKNKNEFIKSMKIIPLKTSDLKEIIRKEIKYKKLYQLFEQAFDSDLQDPNQWYEQGIESAIKNL